MKLQSAVHFFSLGAAVLAALQVDLDSPGMSLWATSH